MYQKNMLQKYIKRQIDTKNADLIEIEYFQSGKETVIELTKDINNKKLQSKILNYIAPYFQLHSELICEN